MTDEQSPRSIDEAWCLENIDSDPIIEKRVSYYERTFGTVSLNVRISISREPRVSLGSHYCSTITTVDQLQHLIDALSPNSNPNEGE
jgi:hypothetical protein